MSAGTMVQLKVKDAPAGDQVLGNCRDGQGWPHAICWKDWAAPPLPARLGASPIPEGLVVIEEASLESHLAGLRKEIDQAKQMAELAVQASKTSVQVSTMAARQSESSSKVAYSSMAMSALSLILIVIAAARWWFHRNGEEI